MIQVRTRRKRLKLFALAILPIAGCDLEPITVTQTVTVEEIMLTVIRGLIIEPLDAAITEAVQDAFGEDEP